jgi:hypothetical protein
LGRIAKESHRVGEVFDSIRVLFQQDEPTNEPIDANEVARETLQSLRGEHEEPMVFGGYNAEMREV